MSFTDQLYAWANGQYRKLSKALKFKDRFVLEGQRRDAPVLVTMLIGYKPDLWDAILPAFEKALPPDCEVCFISPGLHEPRVSAIAQAKGWCYLSCATNDVGLAQNIALREFPQAQLIVKVDEDMFLLPDTLTASIACFRQLKADGVVNPGFVSPMIPINGVCYRDILSVLGTLGEFEQRFGPAQLATSGIPIQTSAEAARWIWEQTGPLADTAQKLKAAALPLRQASIQFSIGCIVFERSFWESFGHFPVYRHKLAFGKNTLGADEAHFCKALMEHFRPGVVCTQALAGHFSFGPQYQGVMDLLRARPALFQV